MFFKRAFDSPAQPQLTSNYLKAPVKNHRRSTRPLDARTKAINAAMRRVAKVVAARARAAGTRIYVMRNGKIVAENP